MVAPRSLPPAFALAASALAAAAALTACGSSGHGSASGSTAASRPAGGATTTTAPATTVPASTTTPPTTLPHDPQPSTEQASATFMDGWMAGNRAQSQSVATAAAVATLYATSYHGQPLNDRGCTDAFPPIVCTWGPYAGGSGSIYQVQLSQAGSSWYVSGVTIDS